MEIPFNTQGFSRRCLMLTAFFISLMLLAASCKTSEKNQASAPAGKTLSQEEQIHLTGLFIDAVREKSLNNPDKAYGLFSQCAKRNPQHAAALYEMANIHNSRHEYKEALTLAGNANKIEPQNEWYLKLLADIYVNMMDYNSAARIVKQLYDKESDDIELAYDLVNLYILAGKYPEAIKVLDGVEKIYGISEETSVQKHKLYLGMGKAGKAINEIEKLVKQFPGEVRYMGLLADLYAETGNSLMAMDMYQRILKLNPGDPFVRLSLAEYYHSQNNEQKSFEELKLAFENPALDIDSKIGILLRYYSFTENRDEKKSQAYELNEIVIRVHPEEAKGWSMYGDYLYRDHRLEDARQAFRKVIAIDSNKYVVWEQLLAIDSELGDHEALLNESRRTIALFPEQAEPYLYNGFAGIRLKKYEEAVRSLKTGLSYAADQPLMVKLYNSLGDANYRLQRYDDSFEAFEKSLKIDARNTYALNNYSYFLALQKQNLQRAEELAERLNELEKGNPLYEDTYGWVLFQREKYSEARQWMEKALAGGGEGNPAILEHYGDVLYKLNDAVRALEYWEKAVAAGGDSPLLKKKINDRAWYEK